MALPEVQKLPFFPGRAWTSASWLMTSYMHVKRSLINKWHVVICTLLGRVYLLPTALPRVAILSCVCLPVCLPNKIIFTSFLIHHSIPYQYSNTRSTPPVQSVQFFIIHKIIHWAREFKDMICSLLFMAFIQREEERPWLYSLSFTVSIQPHKPLYRFLLLLSQNS